MRYLHQWQFVGKMPRGHRGDVERSASLSQTVLTTLTLVEWLVLHCTSQRTVKQSPGMLWLSHQPQRDGLQPTEASSIHIYHRLVILPTDVFMIETVCTTVLSQSQIFLWPYDTQNRQSLLGIKRTDLDDCLNIIKIRCIITSIMQWT